MDEDHVDAPSTSSGIKPIILQDIAAARIASTIAQGRLPPINGRLCAKISNVVIEQLKEIDALNATTVAQMDVDRFLITEADLQDCQLDFKSLSVLLRQPLERLSLYETTDDEYGNPRLRIPSIINDHFPICQTLKYLHLSGLNERFSRNLASTIAMFSALTTLGITNTLALNNTSLVVIVQQLPKLQHLDISNCRMVTNIECLAALTSLEYISLHRLRLAMGVGDIGRVFRHWHNLRVVDLSDERTMEPRIAPDMSAVLYHCSKKKEDSMEPLWPSLLSLDISGSAFSNLSFEQATELVEDLIDRHKKLCNISVINTALDDRVPLVYAVRGDCRIADVRDHHGTIHALSLYWKPNRDPNTHRALTKLAVFLENDFGSFSREDVNDSARYIELAMRYHSRDKEIMDAAIVCLSHLLEDENVRSLDEPLIRACVIQCCQVLEYYPEFYNSIFNILMNDELLRHGNLDCVSICRVALQIMLLDNREHLRRSVDIIRRFGPRVPPNRSPMRHQSIFVEYLISVLLPLSHNVHLANATNFLSTINALKTLTDHFPEDACRQLVDHEEALAMFYNLLSIDLPSGVEKNYCIEKNYYKKEILQCLYNISKIADLQGHLINDPFIALFVAFLHEIPTTSSYLLSPLMRYPTQDRSSNQPPKVIDHIFFTGGILTFLLTSTRRWALSWTKEEVNDLLEKSVLSWPRPDYTLIKMSTYKHMLPLLTAHRMSGAQLWAMRATEISLLSHKVGPKRMAAMRVFESEGGVTVLGEIDQSRASNEVKTIANRLLSFM